MVIRVEKLISSEMLHVSNASKINTICRVLFVETDLDVFFLFLSFHVQIACYSSLALSHQGTKYSMPTTKELF